MRKKPEIIRAPKCPVCKVKTHRVILAGKQAICINSLCNITKFTVQDFGKRGVLYVKPKPNKPNKSYNNSRGKVKENRTRRKNDRV